MTDKTPTDAEIVAVMRDGYNCRYNDEQDHIDFARAVLAKWGQPAQAAEPVAHDEDLLEGLYWEFDAQRKKIGEERLTFKRKMRFYASEFRRLSMGKLAFTYSVSDEMMNLADRLGSEFDDVDPRAWKHLLVYAPRPAQAAEPVAWMVETDSGVILWPADEWSIIAARVIESEFRKQDEALIRQLADALAWLYKQASYPNPEADAVSALTAARARLGEKT